MVIVYMWSLSHVCGVAAIVLHTQWVCVWKIWGDKEFLSLIIGKMEWESPPSILVTKNPN
jgi:hypothetical protein